MYILEISIYLLSIMAEENKTLKELTSNLNLYPYKLVNIKDVNKSILKTDLMKEKVKWKTFGWS